MIRLTGMEAIAHAMEYDLDLCHHSDGEGGFRDDLDVEEARHIAQNEPSMIYLDIDGED